MVHNVLVMIHGIMPDLAPGSHADMYEGFWQSLVAAQPSLSRLFPEGYVGVEWGHPVPGLGAERRDVRLTLAQAQAHRLVNYAAVKAAPSTRNVTIVDPALLPARLVMGPLREGLLLRGVGDAVYYASADGEGPVRETVYEQVFEHLEATRGKCDVRLHVIGHSLGVTIAHDFLYGLFNVEHKPSFLGGSAGAQVRERYTWWRAVAQGQKQPQNALALGSFSAYASQLPLFLQRSQAVIDLLADGRYLDPASIGIVDGDRVRWQLLYEVDDLLAFCTRPLYRPALAIREVQVDTGDNPLTCHSGYWTCAEVIRRTAELLADTAA